MPVKNKLLTWAFFGCLSSVGWGSQAQNFGLEALSTGRAGSVIAEEQNAHSALFNPALLGAQNQSSFSFSTSQTAVKTGSLGSIHLPRSLRRSDEPLSENYSLPDQSQTRWALGWNTPIRLKRLNRNAGLGLSLSGPYEKLRGFVAYAPDDVYLVRYGTADAQFKGTTSLGLELVPKKLFLGAGLSLFLSGAGAAETYLSDTPSSRMNLDVVLRTAPVLGIYSTYGGLSSAITFHESINPTLEQSMKAKIRLNGMDAFEQPLLMKSSLYFEPRTVEGEVQKDFSTFKISLGISYQVWSPYQPPVLITEAPDSTGVTQKSRAGTVTMKNTLNPRASIGVALTPSLDSYLGYQFRPSPVSDLSGEANALDTDTHLIGLSLEQRFSSSFFTETPLRLGVFGQYHRLTERTVLKEDTKAAGGPGFNFSGNAYVVGLSVRAEL